MVQTGDPTGTGKGGDSIWGGPIEDELNPALKVSYMMLSGVRFLENFLILLFCLVVTSKK